MSDRSKLTALGTQLKSEVFCMGAVNVAPRASHRSHSGDSSAGESARPAGRVEPTRTTNPSSLPGAAQCSGADSTLSHRRVVECIRRSRGALDPAREGRLRLAGPIRPHTSAGRPG